MNTVEHQRAVKPPGNADVRLDRSPQPEAPVLRRRFRIVRAETNDIVIVELTVSREHADLTEIGRGLFSLRDLGSTYGTSVLQGSDWSLITAAEVNRDTPVRIGEFETTVAELLREVAGLPVRVDAPAPPPWATPTPRLSERDRARHPETTLVEGDPLVELARIEQEAAPPQPRPMPQSRPAPQPTPAQAARPSMVGIKDAVPILVGLGAGLTIGLVAVVVALSL